jgi:hypothetical protein
VPRAIIPLQAPNANILPDIAGFEQAMEQARSVFGQPVTFHIPQPTVWPADTPIDEDTGQPFDPTVEPESGGEFVDVPKTVLVIYHAIGPGLEAPQASEPAGVLRGETAVLDVALSDYPDIEPATEVTIQNTRYTVEDRQDDGVVGRDRMLIFLEAK